MRPAATFVVFLLCALSMGAARAAEIKVLVAAGLRPVMEALAPGFRDATGHTLSMQFAPADAVTRRVRDGDTPHVVITSWDIDTLAKDGKLVPGSVTILARAGLGLAVRKGAAKPDISSAEAFKRVLLSASAVTFLNPAQKGDSGYHVLRVLDRLGITEAVMAKAVIPQTTSDVGRLVERGEAEFAVLAIQHIEFIAASGVELAGPLPGELQETMVFSAGIVRAAGDRQASDALIAFLRSAAAGSVMRAKGVEPSAP